MEPIYQNPLLDSVHQLFPEFLYDTLLFPHNNDPGSPLGWFRYRVMQLYPQTFRRFRQQYEARDRVNTRNDFEDWVFLQNRQIQAPTQLRMPPPLTRMVYRNEFTTPLGNTFTTPLGNTFTTPRTNIFLNEPVQTPPARNNIIRTWGGEDLGVGLLNLALGANLDNWLATFMDAIPVRPTAAQIDAGSEILQGSSVAEGTMCTICQENAPSPREQENDWRRLRGCMHLFHKTCIDRWFTRNAHCPVCRADIRAHTEPAPLATPSSAETQDSPM
jgi:hypothetical protein